MSIPSENKFHVGVVEDTIVIPGLTPARLSFDEAMNLARCLVEVVASAVREEVKAALAEKNR